MKALFFFGLLLAMSPAAWAGVIFDDNFDSYATQADYEAVWKVDPLYASATLSTEQAYSGTQSIKTLNEVSNKYFNYRDFGAEITATDAQPLVATFWLYDVLAATRQFNKVTGYTGAGYKQGDLQQIYAAGIYNTVTAPGETYDAKKYKARVAFGTGVGWFNLNAPGVPERSTGWHKFTIEVKSTDVNFYVDDILGRTWSRGTVSDLDSTSIGSILSSTGGAAWTDDYRVEQVPEPGALALLALAGLLALRRRA